MAKMISAIERYATALNSLDAQAYLDCFGNEAIVVDPYGSPPAEGEEGLRRWFSGMERTWNEFNMTVHETYIAGDRVAAHWEVRAEGASGHSAHFAGINVFTVDKAGNIVRLEGYWDLQAMLAQLG